MSVIASGKWYFLFQWCARILILVSSVTLVDSTMWTHCPWRLQTFLCGRRIQSYRYKQYSHNANHTLSTHASQFSSTRKNHFLLSILTSHLVNGQHRTSSTDNSAPHEEAAAHWNKLPAVAAPLVPQRTAAPSVTSAMMGSSILANGQQHAWTSSSSSSALGVVRAAPSVRRTTALGQQHPRRRAAAHWNYSQQ